MESLLWLSKALAKPAVVREVVQHFRLRLRSPDEHTQLKAAKSLLLLAGYLHLFNNQPRTEN